VPTSRGTVDPEFKIRLREQEIDVLQEEPSFERVLNRETIDPTYRFDYNTIQEEIPVTVTRNGELGRRGNITRERDNVDMWFFTAGLDIPWAERWIREQGRGGQPDQPSPVQEVSDQEAVRIVDAIRRKLDDSAWNGDGVDNWDGLINIPTASETFTMGSNMTASDGPKEFVKAVIKAAKTAEDDEVSGSRTLGIDSAEAMELIRPYDESSSGGPSAMEMLNQVIDEMVPVQNANLDDLAVLHFQRADNAAFVHATPNGVELVKGRDEPGEPVRMKTFHLASFVDYRSDKSHTLKIDGL
jgi:hypothetical protein